MRWRVWPLHADVSGAIRLAEQIARLQAEKQRLEQELAKTRFVVDVQAKLHALLETLSGSADTDPRSTP